MKNENAATVKTLGMKIRLRRKQLGLSQDVLAEKLFTSKQMISAYENDKVDLKVSVLVDIAAVLDVSPAWFFNDLWEDNSDSAENVMLSLYSALPEELKTVAEDQIRSLAAYSMKSVR